jgi:hypothetical protein
VSKAEVLETESRWALPTALATFLAVVLLVAAAIVNEVSGSGDAEILRSVDAHGGSVTMVGLLRGLAFALLAVPLVYLFRAARARSPQMRSQLIGLVVAAPIFLALSAGFGAAAQQEAADQFVAGEAKSTLSSKQARDDCKSDREDGESTKACEQRKSEDDEASNAQGEASLTPFATGFGIAGGLGFVVVLFYTCLWAMRTGLLSRFWGSLGMALGIATLFGLVIFTLIWFVYFGLLVIGKVPNGRPPAWGEGEAVPWPTPGEQAAAELEPSEGVEPDEGAEPEEKRKRKQRE